ncbi:MAG: class 1 isoprenoid biosynthesis enzyme [Candidatus Paceibacterota bacterium]|jgi:hypothetical protein
MGKLIKKIRDKIKFYLFLIELIFKFFRQARFYKPYINSVIKYIDKSKISEAMMSEMTTIGKGVTLGAIALSFLRGYKINENERKVAMLVGAIEALYDGFFDDFSKDPERIKALVYNIENSDDPYEQLLITLSKELRRLKPIDQNPEFHKTIDLIYNAQVRSLKQKDLSTTIEELINISKEKCGYTVILMRYCLENPLVAGERDAAYSFGALMQLYDDKQDVLVDSRRGIRTFATEIKDSEEIGRIIKQAEEEAVDKLRKMDYPMKNIEKFLLVIPILGKITNLDNSASFKNNK